MLDEKLRLRQMTGVTYAAEFPQTVQCEYGQILIEKLMGSGLRIHLGFPCVLFVDSDTQAVVIEAEEDVEMSRDYDTRQILAQNKAEDAEAERQEIAEAMA